MEWTSTPIGQPRHDLGDDGSTPECRRHRSLRAGIDIFRFWKTPRPIWLGLKIFKTIVAGIAVPFISTRKTKGFGDMESNGFQVSPPWKTKGSCRVGKRKHGEPQNRTWWFWRLGVFRLAGSWGLLGIFQKDHVRFSWGFSSLSAGTAIVYIPLPYCG